MKPHVHTSWFINLLSLLLAAVIWLLFAPTQLGGKMTYVIVDGNSMEPRFHLGDLVIVRKQSTYQVGDAVTYQNAELGRFVFHRISSLELDRFVLKGDHNSWLDSYHPSQDEIIGKLWIHIPTFGKGIQWVREPINFALTSGLLGGILMSSMIISSPQRSKRKNKPSVGFGGMRAGGLYLAGFLTLLFLGLSIFAFIRPLTRPGGNIQYQQEGFFFYSASGTHGLYDSDKVRPGEPVFPKLTCLLNVAYAYNLTGIPVQGMSGNHQLYARVLDKESGWQRTIPLQAETAFTGNTFFSVATLDLCQVESMVNTLEQQTGLRSSVFTLEIVSQMAFTSDIGGKTIKDTFSPSLVFKFDEVHLYLPKDETQGDPLHISKQSLAESSDLQTNTLSFLSWELTVLRIRVIALLGFGVSFSGLLVLGWPIIKIARENKEALFRLKYGALVMDVHEGNLEPTAPIIDVTSMDDLARLAERQSTMILHTKLNFLDYYFVQVNGATYRHVVSTGKSSIVTASQTRSQITQTQITRTETFENLVDNDEYEFVDTESVKNDLFNRPINTDSDKFGRAEITETVLLRKIKL
jgi:signal peptidase I